MSIVPTLDGGNFSSIQKNTSATSKIPIDALTLMETKTKKDKMSLFIKDIMVQTRDGRSYMSIKPKKFKPRESAKTSDGM